MNKFSKAACFLSLDDYAIFFLENTTIGEYNKLEFRTGNEAKTKDKNRNWR